MSDQERLAREWAEDYVNDVARSGVVERATAAAEYILKHTSPPTMADVQWEDKEHAGLGVQVPNGDNRVLISSDTPSLWLTALPDFTDFLLFNRKELTPNGKRYELREKPGHPETLETLEDYQNAPEGTIVAFPDGSPWVKNGGIWESPRYRVDSAELTAGLAKPRTVLRWGDEA